MCGICRQIHLRILCGYISIPYGGNWRIWRKHRATLKLASVTDIVWVQLTTWRKTDENAPIAASPAMEEAATLTAIATGALVRWTGAGFKLWPAAFYQFGGLKFLS